MGRQEDGGGGEGGKGGGVEDRRMEEEEEEEKVAREVGGWGRRRSGRMIAEVNVPTCHSRVTILPHHRSRTHDRGQIFGS